MNADFFNALDLLEKENGISKEYMISQIELAIANSCKKEVGPTTIIRVQLEAFCFVKGLVVSLFIGPLFHTSFISGFETHSFTLSTLL